MTDWFRSINCKLVNVIQRVNTKLYLKEESEFLILFISQC